MPTHLTQDWLNKQFAGTEALLSDVNLGGRWLNQMASAAVKANMTVQYCMSNSRHIMQALQNSVVTQVRFCMLFVLVRFRMLFVLVR